MSEKLIIEKFSKISILRHSGEICLPLKIGSQFVEECTKLNLAIIGLEFFHIQGTKIIPISPLNGIDLSEFLRKSNDWLHIVRMCNERILEVLDEELIRDDTQFFIPTLYEKI